MKDATERGRNSLWRPEYIEEARKLRLLGCTEKEIAEQFDISQRTLANWKEKYSEFNEVIVNYKRIASSNVVNALYKRAIGYDYEEEQAIKIKIDRDMEEVQIVKVKRHAPPDIMACMYYLNNRESAHWRRNPEDNGGSDKPISDQLAELSDRLPG